MRQYEVHLQSLLTSSLCIVFSVITSCFILKVYSSSSSAWCDFHQCRCLVVLTCVPRPFSASSSPVGLGLSEAFMVLRSFQFPV